MKDYYNVPALQRDAADEIERLRNLVDQCDHHEHSLQEAHAEIERLRGIIRQVVADVAKSDYPDMMQFEWLDAAREAVS